MLDAQLTVNVFDGAVFLILALSAILSLFRGFIREFLSLLAWVGAAMFTLYVVKDASEFILPYVKKPFAATVVATIGAYFLALVSISIFNAIIMRYVRAGSDVGAVDNALGLAFGLFKGWVIIVMGFYLMTLVVGEDDYPEWLKTAYSRPLVEKSAKIFSGLLPSYLGDISTLTQKGEEEAPPIEDGDFGLKPKAGEGEGPGYNVEDVLDLQRLLQGTEGTEQP